MISIIFTSKPARIVTAMVSLVFLAASARADLIELTNGDHYRGTVISMNLTNVEFQSEVQGRVRLPRNKVAQITLNAVTPKPTASTSSNAPAVGNSLILSGPSPVNTAPTVQASPQAEAVVTQMRQQGVDPKVVAQVQQQIMEKSSPEASAKFNELMGGLMTGSLSVTDIRNQAQNSINQIKAAKKELGPDAGDMLDSYLAILEKFVNDSSADTATPTK